MATPEISLPLASKFERVIAYMIDMSLLGLPIVYMHYMYTDFGLAFDAYIADPTNDQRRLAYIAAAQPMTLRLFMSYMAYCFFLEGSEAQATIGKRIMKQKVVFEDGSGLSINQSLMRNALKFLSYVPFNIGFIWALFDKKGQAWHDKIARTYVIDDTVMLPTSSDTEP